MAITRIDDLIKEEVIKSLAHYAGNKTQAAKALGITIKTLYNYIYKYELNQDIIRDYTKRKLSVGSIGVDKTTIKYNDNAEENQSE